MRVFVYVSLWRSRTKLSHRSLSITEGLLKKPLQYNTTKRQWSQLFHATLGSGWERDERKSVHHLPARRLKPYISVLALHVARLQLLAKWLFCTTQCSVTRPTFYRNAGATGCWEKKCGQQAVRASGRSTQDSRIPFKDCAHMHVMSLAANGTFTPNRG